MRRLLLAPVAALALFAVGCGGYPSDAKDTFQSGCAKEAAKNGTKGKVVTDYCACTFAYIKARLTYDEFKKADQQISDNKKTSAKAQKTMQGAIAHCRPKTQ